MNRRKSAPDCRSDSRKSAFLVLEAALAIFHLWRFEATPLPDNNHSAPVSIHSPRIPGSRRGRRCDTAGLHGAARVIRFKSATDAGERAARIATMGRFSSRFRLASLHFSSVTGKLVDPVIRHSILSTSVRTSRLLERMHARSTESAVYAPLSRVRRRKGASRMVSSPSFRRQRMAGLRR